MKKFFKLCFVLPLLVLYQVASASFFIGWPFGIMFYFSDFSILQIILGFLVWGLCFGETVTGTTLNYVMKELDNVK